MILAEYRGYPGRPSRTREDDNGLWLVERWHPAEQQWDIVTVCQDRDHAEARRWAHDWRPLCDRIGLWLTGTDVQTYPHHEERT